jgi:DNA (cytosine-5)-methyltransferase 1
MRPKLLDLFCGAGGCSVGYHRAGFNVVGVDINPQPHYPYEFHQADAMTYPLDGYDVIHASPPCQAYSDAGTNRRRTDHPDLLDPIRQRLIANGTPYVIENIPLAPMPTSFILCGSTFGLPIIRHRRFEVHPYLPLIPSLCHQTSHAHAVDHGPKFHPYARGSWEPAWREHVLPTVWPWMTIDEAGQAIPPAYTEYIGTQLLDHLVTA